jgi:hypothetical protein
MPIDAAATMLRAAAHLDAAAGSAARGLEVEMPKLFRRGRAREAMTAEFALAASQARQAVRELEPLGAPVADARAAIDESLPKFDPALLHRRIDNAREFGEFTDATTRLRVVRDRLRLQAQLASTPADVARARLQADVDSILDLPPDAINDQHVWRLGVISGLPEQLRPRLPAPVKPTFPVEYLGIRGLDYMGRMARNELHNLRLDRMRRVVEADPTVTREGLEAELRSIVAADPSIETPRELDRIAVMAGLPERLRPRAFAAPEVWTDYPMSSLGVYGGDRGMGSVVRMKVDALRMAHEHELMVADPAVTRDTVSKEVVGLLTRPVDSLGEDEMRRLSVLMRAPEQLRPALPPRVDPHYVFEDLGLLRRIPARDLKSRDIYLAGRLQLLTKEAPDVLVGELRTLRDRHFPMDPRLVAALLADHPELIERAGVRASDLHTTAINLLAGGERTPRDIGDQLAIIRIGVERATPADDVQRAMRDELLALVDRNIARVRGEVRDTFSNHPDYAELGRIVENARLLRTLEQTTLAHVGAPARDVTGVVAW